jgi:dienelactone hydrolase
VISHGAGGSENGYRYLAAAMAQLGYTAVVMGHRESGLAALSEDMRADGIRRGVHALVADPEAEQARLLDVGAALQWADGQCHAPFRVLLGHSMGAETVMLEAGAKNIIGVSPSVAGQDRFSEHSWSAIHKPLLVLTGTRDQSLKGGPQARQIPWHDLPGITSKCQWMAVIDGATHMNFAGNGMGAEQVKPMVTQTIASFLSGIREAACTLPTPRAGMTMQAK